MRLKGQCGSTSPRTCKVQPSSRPVILLGHGVRAAGAAHLVPKLLELGVPVLTSWQAKDLVDNDHQMYFGSPGIYGQRCANKVLHNADEVLAIGNRLAIWNVGYAGIRDDQKLYVVEASEAEAKRYRHAQWVGKDCREFLEQMEPRRESGIAGWVAQCRMWSETLPWLEPGTHDDTNGYINSYRFTAGLQKYLAPDEQIVTDMGTALVCAHQLLHVKPPQRLMTSGGLGEMGCALPAAIGASFARGKGRVLCLHCDGGMMLNLQELQTIVHHKLPIKIIVYRNEGYLMIRHTQNASGMREHGITTDSGVSFPNFRHVALAFGISASEIRTWDDYERIIPGLFSHDGPQLVEYHMDPRQPLVPKLGYDFQCGKQVYSSFDDMSPKLKKEPANG
jgi:acetolactate synthase I/II/III large subunit